MKIENFRSEKLENRARVTATVVWEDCDRPTHELYFETTEEFAPDLSPNPHAFLVASIMPALYYGEARVAVDAEICPELKDGLVTAMSHIHHWYSRYGPERQLVHIEAKACSGLPTPRTPERAGCFFSGGIDSLATLRSNRLGYPLQHPGSIKDGVLIYGFDFGKSEDLDELQAFENLRKSLLATAEDAGITLIPVYTNIRQKFDTQQFWYYEFSGAALAAVAHAFAQRLTVVSIAAGLDASHLTPLAQHPLLDPNYSSYNLRIRHDGTALSRLAKTKLVAGWDVALQNLKVCNYIERLEPGQLNCGRCEKCIRTITTLIALGVRQARTFYPFDVSEELLVNQVYPKLLYVVDSYQELIPLLEDRGRHDLARGIRRITTRYYEKDLKGRVKQFDRKYFRGKLLRLKP